MTYYRLIGDKKVWRVDRIKGISDRWNPRTREWEPQPGFVDLVAGGRGFDTCAEITVEEVEKLIAA